MFSFLVSILLLGSQALWAQESPRDLQFIETQNTQAMPFSIPVYLDTDGNLSIISNKSSTPLSFRTNTQVAWNNATSLFIKPIKHQGFAFEPQKQKMEWIQVKRKRWEFGLGLGSLTSKLPFSFGLTPYKGARTVMTRNLLTKDEKVPKAELPKTLDIVKEWREGDNGSFQTYGGIHILAGIGSSGASLSGGITFQSLFSVGVMRLPDNKVQLSISEENLNKRRLQASATVAIRTLQWISGKRFTSVFTLDLDNNEHYELYAQAVKGKLSELQKALPTDAQKMEWKGNEKIAYYGIPGVAGKYFYRSEYVMDKEGEVDILDTKSRRNSGIFVPMRNYNNLVYQTENDITLYWFADMNKAHEALLTKRFLTPGRVMGAQGFEAKIPEGQVIGSTLSQMGISFTRKELDNISPELFEEVMENFKLRCEEMKLDCASPKKYSKLVTQLESFRNQPWVDVRDKLGFMMLENPALIYAYIKSIKSKKSIYFKFLNQKYQSMEGSALIVI